MHWQTVEYKNEDKVDWIIEANAMIDKCETTYVLHYTTIGTYISET